MSKNSIRHFRGVTRRTFIAVGASVLLFAACGTSDQSAVNTVADTVAEASTDTAVPEVSTNKIVSLSATATEMIYAIGAEDQLVAVDNYSNYPEAAASFETTASVAADTVASCPPPASMLPRHAMSGTMPSATQRSCRLVAASLPAAALNRSWKETSRPSGEERVEAAWGGPWVGLVTVTAWRL